MRKQVIIAKHYDEKWSEVFDIMELDKEYTAEEISPVLFPNYAKRTALDYTRVILNRLVYMSEVEGHYSLIVSQISKPKKYKAPSYDFRV